MAIKTFTTGEVLTAADTNTYLANSGLVYVTSASASSGSSISISNCFTSTYTNYRVFVNCTIGTSGSLQVRYQAGASVDSANSYRWARFYGNADSTAQGQTGQVTGTEITVGQLNLNIPQAFMFDVFNPQLAINTGTSCQPYIEPTGSLGTLYLGWSASSKNTTTQYDGAVFYFPGTISAATVTIYGYRKG